MLQMNGVSRIFRVGNIETHALREIDFEVAPGEFLAVLGPSGSGKSTLLNLAGLLDQFDSGTYILDGEDVSRLSDNARSEVRNKKIGFVFQSFNLIHELNVFRNVEVPLRYQGLYRDEREQRVEEALRLVGLASRASHLPNELSGGQQQRVAIARALASRPRLLLADEPTGNLDTEMAQEVMELLAGIKAAGTTIVMVTHDLQLAARADRKVHIVDGVVAIDG